MFIPIDAKADVDGSKKGKLTPAQHAQLNAWSLAGKTGILDCLDKCQATSTSYTAIDDIATVVFKKGYFVICGRLVECEAGTSVTIRMPASGSVSGSIVARYDLSSSGNSEFSVIEKTGALDKDDLNDNPISGKHDFVLYNYTANRSTGIVRLTRNTEYIPSVGSKFEQIQEDLEDGHIQVGYANTADYARIANYASADTSKGTIEERLTRLGFNEGSVTVSAYLSGVTLTKMGKYAILKYAGGGKAYRNFTMSMSDGFAPKESFTAYLSNTVLSSGFKFAFVKGSNIVNVSASWDNYGDTVPPFQIGFEIQ